MKYLGVMFVLVAACGKSSDGESSGAKSTKANAAAKVASCNMPKAGTCTEYGPSQLAVGTDNLAKLCKVGGVELEMTACPEADRASSCANYEGTRFYYKSSPITVEEAEKQCAGKGKTFTRY